MHAVQLPDILQIFHFNLTKHSLVLMNQVLYTDPGPRYTDPDPDSNKIYVMYVFRH